VDRVTYEPIGIVRSPFSEPEGTPIQPTSGRGVRGVVEIRPEFAGGLKDLDGFSHIILIYHFNRSKSFSLEVVPFLDDTPRGVFATRAPARPNAIGLSVVRLVGIQGTTLTIEDIDILDGTPLLDIKPHVPETEPADALRLGWLAGKTRRFDETKSDKRFT
jgi:tRNA (adenine37-N6)-methyltransferase